MYYHFPICGLYGGSLPRESEIFYLESSCFCFQNFNQIDMKELCRLVLCHFCSVFVEMGILTPVLAPKWAPYSGAGERLKSVASYEPSQ